MSGFTIDITGNVSNGLDKITDQVKQIINDELYGFALETVSDAKQNVNSNGTIDNGFLINSIASNVYPDQLSVEIIVAAYYAAFIEFGTGQFAAAYVSALPIEIQEYAMTFFVNGKGRLPARPFLFPALEANIIKLKEHLKTI